MEAACTIFFEDPFWVAVFERRDDQGYAVARFVFGAEPTNAQLLEFALRRYLQLVFSRPEAVPRPAGVDPALNFKRRQRELRRRQSQTPYNGSRAQQALKAEEERRQSDRTEIKREEQQRARQEEFHQRQEKKKNRRRGH